jgi:voltage-gated potassium channel
MANDATGRDGWGFRVQELVRRRTERAIVKGRVLPYLAGAILLIATAAAAAIWLVDRSEFPTFGDGLWWAVVTLGTVGYGDLVPNNTPGRVVGGVVIMFGVTSIALLTSVVTSHFVATKQKAEVARAPDHTDEPAAGGSPDDVRATLEHLRSELQVSLQAIEATLERIRRGES